MDKIQYQTANATVAATSAGPCHGSQMHLPTRHSCICSLRDTIDMKFFSCLAVFAVYGVANASASKVHPSVYRKLQQDRVVNVLVSFKDGVQAALNNVIIAEEGRVREERVVAVVESLEQHAQAVQKDVLALAAKYNGAGVRDASGGSEKLLTKAESLWLTNQVYITNATPKFVQMISSLDTVAAVIEDELLPFTDPKIEIEVSNGTTGGYDSPTNEVQWGVTKVRAPELWSKGITGNGIVIGSIDTGVRVTHEAVQASYRAEYGWFDAIGQKTAPYDDVGHGSHTIATMAGQLGYGVAPGAKWISCKACGPDGCLGSALVKCAQWMTCPTAADGTRDCTKAPHVINNSWGGGKSLSYFSDAIDGWRKAGIIPVFSNGNSGPACSTVSSPADLATVISVGATDRNDSLASFSSKGPVGTLVKPDISAPGALIRSALQTADNAYGFMSGTSMAAPHVTGTIALMLSQNTKLTFNDIVTLLRGNLQVAGLKDTGRNCGGIAETQFPNNAYGAGRLDAVLVVQKLVPTTPAPTPAPTPAKTNPTSPPFQQRPQQQQQYGQRPIPRSAEEPTPSSGTEVVDPAATTDAASADVPRAAEDPSPSSVSGAPTTGAADPVVPAALPLFADVNNVADVVGTAAAADTTFLTDTAALAGDFASPNLRRR